MSKSDDLKAELKVAELEEKLVKAKDRKGALDSSKEANRKLKEELREARRQAREARESA